MTDWLAGLDKTTRAKLRQELVNFVEIQGYTIGDVVSGLPFDEMRAQRIAITEITRVYAQSELLAGDQLLREFPDILVIKTWFTNNDDKVCEICAPLHGKRVPLNEMFMDVFGDVYDAPPAHVNCRCWMSSRTKI
jgi:SPP1 gp7 family putative phage head morphogenesis protein